MRATTQQLIACSFALAIAFVASPLLAQQGVIENEADVAEKRQAEWEYRQSVGIKTPQQIIREKAQVRAAQRMTRMAALEWYGYSVARPRTSATPFTAMYGGQWQGDVLGRPNAWHAPQPVQAARRTVVVGY